MAEMTISLIRAATVLNDIGPNTAATTFSAAGLITAYATLTTMKDRKAGRYLGISPDTLIVTPQLEFAAKQLLLAQSLFPVGTGATAGAPFIYGAGTSNPFRGLINRIIVTPWLGTSYDALN
jgi:phage major head subunit gpT-like protein